MKSLRHTILLIVLLLFAVAAHSATPTPPGLLATGDAWTSATPLVSTSMFHWYTSAGGQLTSPWVPLEGRANWTGTTEFWKTQIKQTMAANIDLYFVHLIPHMDQQRINLLQALGEMRADGYRTPQIAPFLDPLITWNGTWIDVATTVGKDAFAAEYTRFFNQYYGVNTDPHADEFVATFDGRVVLDTWHVHLNLANYTSLSRADVETRLAAQFGATHPIFNNGVHMIGTGPFDHDLPWCDEVITQFALHSYFDPQTHNGIKTVQLKAGYWDQNIRTPGYFMARDGGASYAAAWLQLFASHSDTVHIYIESWNEYDEGSGIYATDPGPPYIAPGSDNPSTDTWSATDDPYEYIRQTAQGARAFNATPDLDSAFLTWSFPAALLSGQVTTASVTVRNEGDVAWSGGEGFGLAQNLTDYPGETAFAVVSATIDDAANEVGVYGGVFRGRPVTCTLSLQAPANGGAHVTHWNMIDDTGQPFGETLEIVIGVLLGDAPTIIISDAKR